MNASIIFNRHAGTHNLDTLIKQAGRHLQSHGWRITWLETRYPGHATQLARQSVAREDAVAIAAGGDGTINEVMNGLVGSSTALGILPAGTANVFAADLHIPLPGPLPGQTLIRAADGLLHGRVKAIDVAQATFGNGLQRYFLLWAGIGLDAAVSRAVQTDTIQRPTLKSLGFGAWMIAAFFVLREFRGTRMRIKVDYGHINRRIIMTTINNSQLYGRFWRLSPEAKVDDGLLDVVVMEGYGFRSSLKHIGLVLLDRHAKDPQVHIYRTRAIRIETQEQMPVHLDAECVGTTPVTVKIAPKQLRLLLPPTAPHYLFTDVDEGD